jgi:hypothetical protein
MATSRLAFEANERIERQHKALSVVHDNILLYKGFLGNTIRERGIATTGMRAARAAGVIVDELGKMRCPPGTPNANQFTDINMSNCMTPSAATIAEMAERLMQKASDGFRFGRPTLSTRRDNPPMAKLGAADANGRNIPFSLPTADTSLGNWEKAIEFVRDGGDLSSVPDEHLIQSIFQNLKRDDNLNGRFTVLGTGGGVNGMIRIKDNKTNADLGVKFQSVYLYNETGAPKLAYAEMRDGYMPEFDSFRTGTEPIKEVISNAIMEEFGYPSSSMRLVKNTSGGHALVTELAHNRWSESFISAQDPELSEVRKISTKGLVTISVFDSIIANVDRHGGNYLLTDSGGERMVVPIDNGSSFYHNAGETWDYGSRYIIRQAPGRLLATKTLDNPDTYNDVVDAVAKLQAELLEIDTEALETRLRAMISGAVTDENSGGNSDLQRTANQAFGIQMDADQNPVATAIPDQISLSMQRIREFIDADPDDAAQLIVAKPPSLTAQETPSSALSAFAETVGVIGRPGDKTDWVNTDGIWREPEYPHWDGITDPLGDGTELTREQIIEAQRGRIESGDWVVPNKVDVGDFAGDTDFAPPEVSSRSEGSFVPVVFDPDTFDGVLDARVEAMVKKYLPTATSRDFEVIGEDLMVAMGVPKTEQSAKDMVGLALTTFLDDSEQNIRMLKGRLDDENLADTSKAYAQVLIREIERSRALAETEDGRKILKAKMSAGLLQSLHGVDLMTEANPNLRGAIAIQIHDGKVHTNSNERSAAYTYNAVTPDGKIYAVQRYKGSSLLYDDLEIDELKPGEMFENSVRINGTDNYQVGLAIHETAHNAHFSAVASRYGVKYDTQRSVADQLKVAGPNIGDSLLGSEYALRNNIRLDTPLDSIDDLDRAGIAKHLDIQMRSDPLRVNGPGIKPEDIDDPANWVSTLFGFPTSADGDSQRQSNLANLIKVARTGSAPGRLLPENIQTRQQAKEMLDQLFEGDWEDELRGIEDALSDAVGVDYRYKQTGGLSYNEVMESLGVSSAYGSTEPKEAIAEATLLISLLDTYPGAKSLDEFQTNRIREALSKAVPPQGDKPTVLKALSPAQRKTFAKMMNILNQAPQFEWDTTDVV